MLLQDKHFALETVKQLSRFCGFGNIGHGSPRAKNKKRNEHATGVSLFFLKTADLQLYRKRIIY
jgi:hypothetical protein